MKAATWLGAVVVLGMVVVLLGCGSKDSAPPAPSAGGPPPGAGPMGPPAPAVAEPEKPKADAKPEDDSDDPWFGEKKTVTGAIGKALLRGWTRGGGGPKKEELPVLIK